MVGEAKPKDTPEAFLETLAETLKGKVGVDLGLIEILKTHILTVVPARNAVAQAKDAIVKLADERVSSLKSEVVND